MIKFPWQDAAQYQYTDKLKGAELAWEFLRRNQEYQKDFKRVITGQDKARRYIPPLKAGETVRQWHHRCIKADIDPIEISAEEFFARKWGLSSRLVDPELSASQNKKQGGRLRFFDSEAPEILERWSDALQLKTFEYEGETFLDRDSLIVRLPLARSFFSQSRFVQDAFQQKRKQVMGKPLKSKSPKVTKPSILLRLYDSQHDKMPKKKRAQIIFGTVQDPHNLSTKHFDGIDTARRLIDGQEYRYLAFRS